jgi:DNA (cytosine-5)-methyltransferase 1
MKETLKVLDLFSGIGGFSYAAENLVGDFKTTQFVEINPYCQKVLRKNFPNVPIHDDITTFNATEGQFDILTCGFPCQDLSIAGKQEGIGEGTRSGLFFEILRLARQIRPKFILFENVRNLLSHSEGETYQKVLQEIAKAGFNVEWSVIPAKDVGACHRRERLWFIAYPSSVNKDRTESTLQAGRDTSTSSTSASTNTDSERLQGLRAKHQLREGSQEETPCWSSQPYTLDPDWRGYLSQPTIRRGDDGFSNRVDRLKCLGNSIVPQVAAVPLARIKQLHSIFY